jgi:hypothetical protein
MGGVMARIFGAGSEAYSCLWRPSQEQSVTAAGHVVDAV